MRLDRREHRAQVRLGRERGVDEVVRDLVVLAPGEQDHVGLFEGAAGAPDLLVVGDHRTRPLEVDDEAEVGLVEAHAERDGRDQRLDLVRAQGVLEPQPVLGFEAAVVRRDRDSRAESSHAGDALAVGDREAVDDAGAGQSFELLGEPGEAFGLVAEFDRLQPEAVARQRAADDDETGPELRRDVGDDAVVRRRRRREDGNVARQQRDDAPDAPVVGPEVVAPVGDAVRLVDDEQPDRALDDGQRPLAEAWVRRVAPARRCSRSTSFAAIAASISGQVSVLALLIERARTPARSAIVCWSRISDRSGLISSVGPCPASRRRRVARK